MPGTNDGITECAFCVCAGEERFSDETQLGGIVNVVAGLVSIESGCEFVGVVEDLLGGAGHGGYLRYFGRAGMSCTMIGPVEGVDHVAVGDAVLACAGSNERRIHVYKLACAHPRCKLPCPRAR